MLLLRVAKDAEIPGQEHMVWWGSHPCRAASCRAFPLPPPPHTGTTPQEGTDSSESVFVFRLHSRCYTVPTGPRYSSHLKPTNTHTTQNLALTGKTHVESCPLVHGFNVMFMDSQKRHKYAPNIAVAMETEPLQFVLQIKWKPAAKKGHSFQW